MLSGYFYQHNCMCFFHCRDERIFLFVQILLNARYVYMPFVRLYSPKLSLAKRRHMMKEITAVLLHALKLAPSQAKDYCTVQFAFSKLDEMVIGGRLLSEDMKSRGVNYTIELHERNLDKKKRGTPVHEITANIAKIFEVKSNRLSSINILIPEYNPSTDFAVSGKFVGQPEKKTVSKEVKINDEIL
jgi:phenylpyruvate tautomerase PptA (4-oxalocrotonate tautomerase family)